MKFFIGLILLLTTLFAATGCGSGETSIDEDGVYITSSMGRVTKLSPTANVEYGVYVARDLPVNKVDDNARMPFVTKGRTKQVPDVASIVVRGKKFSPQVADAVTFYEIRTLKLGKMVMRQDNKLVQKGEAYAAIKPALLYHREDKGKYFYTFRLLDELKPKTNYALFLGGYFYFFMTI